MALGDTLDDSLELMGRILRRWGFSEKDIAIYTALLLSPGPMTMKDISEKTGFSLSTVSQSLNNLVRYYMVKPEKRGRVRVFTAVPMFYELFLNQPVEMLDKEVIPLKQRLLELRGKMPELRDRIDLILSNLSNMECVLNEIIRIKNNNICVNNRKA